MMPANQLRKVLFSLVTVCATAMNACHVSRTGMKPAEKVVTNTTNVHEFINNSHHSHWPYLDLYSDSVPGISLDKAYHFLKGKTGQQVIVGVIDSGVDIDHDALKKIVWVNKKEIPDNGMDDDGNNFVDDIHGWNFIGSEKGNMLEAPLEITRMIGKYARQLEGMDSLHKAGNPGLEKYRNLKGVFDRESENVSRLYARLVASHNSRQFDSADVSMVRQVEKQNRFHYNIDFDPRTIIGDDPDDINDTGYGNNIVTGYKELEPHGTHVSGIIASFANRADRIRHVRINLRIMPVRVIPDGDEYDKDVVLAIRYAVDNGASVINMSFGKDYSPNRKWVWEAMLYAQDKDVLLIQSAGNSHRNIDKQEIFPTDINEEGVELVNNLITVGSTTWNFNESLVAPFSNYGKGRVDVFAPGQSIYSTMPGNRFGFDSGTSMSAPFVTGIAALIRSYYPGLSARQVKQIVLDSGIPYDGIVIVPGTELKTTRFSELSTSGRIVNAVNALLMADELSRRK